MPQTTFDFLKAVKRRGIIPVSQTSFTDSDILETATIILRSETVPMIVQLNEDYFTFISAVEGNGQTEIKLPKRVSGSVLKDVFWKGTGNERQLKRFSSSERINQSGADGGYYMSWNHIHLLDDSLSSGTFLFHFYIEPSRLVEVSRSCRITGIDTNTSTLTVSNLPDGFSGTGDFIRGTSPYDFIDIDREIASTNSGTPSVSFASLPDGLSVGDYITLAGESPLIQLPDSFQSVLVEQTCIDILTSMGDMSAANKMSGRLNEKIARLIEMGTPRVKHGEIKIIADGGGL